MATTAVPHYIVPLAQGRESDPLPLSKLYEMARDGRLGPRTKVFDVGQQAWVLAADLPPLAAIYRQVIPGFSNEPGAGKDEITVPPPLMRRVVLSFARLFGKDEVL